jgi:hypothetical protein
VRLPKVGNPIIQTGRFEFNLLDRLRYAMGLNLISLHLRNAPEETTRTAWKLWQDTVGSKLFVLMLVSILLERVQVKPLTYSTFMFSYNKLVSRNTYNFG